MDEVNLRGTIYIKAFCKNCGTAYSKMKDETVEYSKCGHCNDNKVSKTDISKKENQHG